MKKIIYIKCPRCDLNYIDKKAKLCDICKAEMKLLDPSILIPDEDEESERLCPVCHENFITIEEDMCYECSKDRDDIILDDEDIDEEWKFVAEVVDEPLPVEEIGIDLSDELDEEDIGEDFSEEEYESDFEEDFDTEIDDDFDQDIDDDDEDEFDEDDDF